jgi:hypothetical protein
MERLSRDEHADVRPNCADTVSTNARAFYESEPCARWLHAIAKYALEELSNSVLAAEYRTTLPHDRLLAEEIAQTRRQLNLQCQNAFRALPRRRRARHSRSRRAWQGHHLIAEGGRRLGGASQITAAAEPLSLHRQISRSLPPNSATAHAIHALRQRRYACSHSPRNLPAQVIQILKTRCSSLRVHRIRKVWYAFFDAQTRLGAA